jgi:hypothetical protein
LDLDLMVGGETECSFKIGLDEDDGDDYSCNGQSFEGDAFHLGTLWAESLSGARFISIYFTFLWKG